VRLTDVLDLAGLLLLVAALAWTGALLLGAPVALAVAGLGLLAVSWLVDARSRTKRKEPTP